MAFSQKAEPSVTVNKFAFNQREDRAKITTAENPASTLANSLLIHSIGENAAMVVSTPNTVTDTECTPCQAALSVYIRRATHA